MAMGESSKQCPCRPCRPADRTSTDVPDIKGMCVGIEKVCHMLSHAVTSCAGYKYHRMDGSTAVVNRMRLMDDFNESPRTFAFLLTTKVGGIGVNLTGANRCSLYELEVHAAPQRPLLRKAAAAA